MPPAEFYELPFPNDIRRGAGGRADLTTYPRLNAIVDGYTNAISADLDGFGLNAAIFVRFGGPIDRASLPATPPASLADDASVYLVDIDPASPDRGQKHPIKLRFEPKKGSTIGANWLSALPYPGFPLAEGTTYALVITNRVRVPGSGLPVEPSSDFVAVAGPDVPNDAALAAAQHTYAALWTYLDQPGGDERADVVNAAVFTTQHATDMAGLLRQKIWSLPAPPFGEVIRTSTRASIIMYDGLFVSPNFQVGVPPYSESGGQIELGDDGLPIVQVMETVRFSFALPRLTTMPPGGWPVVIYGTGTGGDFHSYFTDNISANVAPQGIALIAMDQVLTGERNPRGLSQQDFYNVFNPQAARHNVLQGAADYFSLSRLLQGLSFVEPPAGIDPGRTIRFDATKIYYVGHSQGGLTGVPFLAFEPAVKAAVLSGTSALLYLGVLDKKQPFDIAALVKSYIPDDPFDEFNPVLALVQTWIERSEPANYGPLLARKPTVGADGTPLAPKAIFQTEGFVDSWSPNRAIEAFATSVGGNQIRAASGRGIKEIEGLTLRGRQVLTPPVTGNLDGTTAVLLQYDQLANSDGHFVALEVPAAQVQWSQFLGVLARTGTATVPP